MAINIATNFSVRTTLPIDNRIVFANLTDRDALDLSFRYIGLFVYVVAEQKFYYLKSGITNPDWSEFSSAGATPPEIEQLTVLTNGQVDFVLAYAPIGNKVLLFINNLGPYQTSITVSGTALTWIDTALLGGFDLATTDEIYVVYWK